MEPRPDKPTPPNDREAGAHSRPPGARTHAFYEEIGRKGGEKVRALIEAGKRAR